MKLQMCSVHYERNGALLVQCNLLYASKSLVILNLTANFIHLNDLSERFKSSRFLYPEINF